MGLITLWEYLLWMVTNYPWGFFGGITFGILSIKYKNWPGWIQIVLLLAPTYSFSIYTYMHQGEWVAWGTLATQFGVSLAGILVALFVMAGFVVFLPKGATQPKPREEN